MADYDKYDPRVDALAMETRTLWDPEVGEVSAEDRAWLAEAIQAQPQQAAKVAHDRSHTGFTRTITVTIDDIERLYRERVGT